MFLCGRTSPDCFYVRETETPRNGIQKGGFRIVVTNGQTNSARGPRQGILLQCHVSKFCLYTDPDSLLCIKSGFYSRSRFLSHDFQSILLFIETHYFFRFKQIKGEDIVTRLANFWIWYYQIFIRNSGNKSFYIEIIHWTVVLFLVRRLG